MPYTFHIKATDNDTGERRVINGTLADKELQILEQFLSASAELGRCAWVRNGMPCGLDVTSSEGAGLSAKVHLPPWDEVIVFLHRFRPFGLQKEPTFLPTVCNTLGRLIADAGIRGVLSLERERFSGKNFRSQVSIVSNGVVLNSEETLNKWLNAFEYHLDRDKQDFLASIHGVLPLEASKPIFLQLLSNRAIAVFNIDKLISVMLAKKHKAQLEIQKPPAVRPPTSRDATA